MWGGRRFFFQHAQKGWEWEGGEETRVLPPQFRSPVKEWGTLPGSPVPEVRCASPSANRSKEKGRGRRLVHHFVSVLAGCPGSGVPVLPQGLRRAQTLLPTPENKHLEDQSTRSESQGPARPGNQTLSIRKTWRPTCGHGKGVERKRPQQED